MEYNNVFLKNVQKMWENYLFRKYFPFVDSFDKILYE